MRLRLLSALLALTLGGCVAPNAQGVYAWPSFTCRSDASEQVEKANWDKMRQIGIRIRQGQYDPMILTMQQGKTYKLSISNGDWWPRGISSWDFLSDAVAVRRVSTGGEDHESTCIRSVWIPGEGEAEIEFVAIRDGRYDFKDALPAMDLHPSLPAAGVMVIEYTKPKAIGVATSDQ